MLEDSSGGRDANEVPNVYLPDAELKALQSVFEAAETVDWAAYERAKIRIRHARLDTIRPNPAKADIGNRKRFEKAG